MCLQTLIETVMFHSTLWRLGSLLNVSLLFFDFALIALELSMSLEVLSAMLALLALTFALPFPPPAAHVLRCTCHVFTVPVLSLFKVPRIHSPEGHVARVESWIEPWQTNNLSNKKIQTDPLSFSVTPRHDISPAPHGPQHAGASANTLEGRMRPQLI